MLYYYNFEIKGDGEKEIAFLAEMFARGNG